MTLDRLVARAVRDALDVETVPDEAVRAVEGDEELHLLAEASRNLELVDDPDAASASHLRVEAHMSTEIILRHRVWQLLEEENVSGWSE